MDLEILTRLAPNTRFRSLLFVHGGFHAVWCWNEYFLPYFASHDFDAYALSLRGHGRSAGQEKIDEWGLGDYCDDVRQVCEGFQSPPILVGHSIGAVVIQQYTQSHEAAALVMLAPMPLASMTIAKLRWMVRFPIVTAKMLLARDVNHARPAFRHLFFSRDMGDEQVDRYMARLQRESNRVFRDISRIRDPNPNGARLPALILVAEHDRIPRRINQRLADAFPGELQTLPIAHDVMLNSRWQMVADRIIEWIMNLEPVTAG